MLKLALLATDYRCPPSEAAHREEERQRNEMLALAAEQGMETFARKWLDGLVAPEADAGVVEAMVEMIARHSVQELAAHTLAALRRPDYTDVLDAVDVPALILAGDSDFLRPKSIHREMAQRIRNSRLVIVEKCGHMLAMEWLDAVSGAMREWLLS